MRTTLSAFIMLAAMAATSGAQLHADDAKPGAANAKTPLSDKQIFGVLGSRMSKVFSSFGYPVDMYATEASSDNPSVFFDYGSYGFKIRHKVIQSAFIFPDWKGTVFGATMGDSQDDVVKKLGKPVTTAKGSDGLPYLVWNFKDQPGKLEIDFNKDNKMNRAVISAD